MYLQKDHYAAVIVILPPARTTLLPPHLKTALTTAIYQKLRPGGLMLTEPFHLPREQQVLEEWQQTLQQTFQHTEIQALSATDGFALVARRHSPAL